MQKKQMEFGQKKSSTQIRVEQNYCRFEILWKLAELYISSSYLTTTITQTLEPQPRCYRDRCGIVVKANGTKRKQNKRYIQVGV